MTNIASSNIKYKPCDNKCEYVMFYEKGSINSTNHDTYILATPQSAPGSKSVIYAEEPYTVINIKIVQPSIHLFDGNQLLGEIIINHSRFNSSSSDALNVCIPINNAKNLSKGSNIISSIINATKTGGSATSNIAPFSIMEIIPEQPFYTYTSNNNTKNIVFDLKDAINIDDNTTSILTTLTSYIAPNTNEFATKGDIFISKNPPSNGNVGSDVLYDCMLVDEGESEEMLLNKQNLSTSSGFSTNTINMFWQVLTIIIVILLIVLIPFIIKLMVDGNIVGKISNQVNNLTNALKSTKK